MSHPKLMMSLQTSSSKWHARLIPHVPGRLPSLTPIRTTCQRLTCILWVFCFYCNTHSSSPSNASSARSLNELCWLRDGPGSCTSPFDEPGVVALIVVFASRWINGETGVRSDVPHHLIYPLKETRPNLHIVTGIHVKRVTFDEYVLVVFFS